MGTAYAPDEVEKIAKIASENALTLIHDITYRDFSLDHCLATNFYKENTVLAYSFSKTMGFAGMRLGALIAPKKMMDNFRPFDTNVLSANAVAQAGAKKALEIKSKWLPDMLDTANANQEVIKKAVDKVEGAFIPVFPSRTNMLVIDISGTGKKPDWIQEQMLKRHGVFVRGGGYVSKGFGERFLRVSFTVPREGAQRFYHGFLDVMKS